MSIQEAYDSKPKTSINPFGYFIAVIRERPDAGRAAHVAAFKRLVLGEDSSDYAEAIVDEWCSLRYSTALEAAVPLTPADLERRANERAQRKRAADKAAADLAQRIIGGIAEITLAYVMPNGRPLAENTFADCAETGGFFLDVAKLGKPAEIVGDVITADQLAKLKAKP